MLQQDVAEDFVIATGKQFAVRDFVVAAGAQLDMKIEWKGTGVDEVGNREERLDLGGELVGPRLSGRRRPLGELGPVP